MTNNIDKAINRIVKKYPWRDSELLFKSELEHLVEVARKEAKEEIAVALRPELGNFIKTNHE